MYSRVFLLIAAGALLGAQTPGPALRRAQEALAAARDAETLSRSTPFNELTEEQAEQMEQAAQRQLNRARTRLEEARVLVNEGLAARQTLTAPEEEVALAQSDYDLVLARTTLVRELAAIVRTEDPQTIPLDEYASVAPVMERFDGTAPVTSDAVRRIKTAFEHQFHEVFPVSADGETAVHRAMGFDHRNRVDVALVPATTEGVWLRHFLEAAAIPYYAFRSSVPGKATGAHIHIGPPSGRIPVPGRG